jgi:hypothetical protein
MGGDKWASLKSKRNSLRPQPSCFEMEGVVLDGVKQWVVFLPLSRRIAAILSSLTSCFEINPQYRWVDEDEGEGGLRRTTFHFKQHFISPSPRS